MAWAHICDAHFHSTDFESAVRAMLEAIRTAGAGDRPRRAAQFGGLLRRERNHARTLLASALMQELGIEPTQHVGRMIMRLTFNTAASTAWLDKFALPGRDASVKHMDRAREVLGGHPEIVRQYARRYAWFCRELKRHVRRLRGDAATAPSASPSSGRRRAGP